MNQNIKLKKMILTAMFAALVFVATMYIHLPIPMTNGGYIHLGDTFIYLAACLLPAPYAIAAAVIGAGLSDLMFSMLWVIPTILIKGIIACLYSDNGEKIISKRNVYAVGGSAIITVVGYYLAEVVLFNFNFYTPLVSMIGNLVQGVGNGLIFFIIGATLDKFDFKKMIYKNR